MFTKLKYWFLVGVCKAVGFLPSWFLYHCLLDVLYFLLYRVARYRVGVVRSNLESSFPEKDKGELRRIEREYYRYLAELFIDAVDIVGISERGIRKRIVFEYVEAHEAEVAGRDWIAALAHYGSWEYFSAYQLYTASQVAGVYKSLHDKAFGMFYNYSRSRFGLEPVDRKNILRYLVAATRDQSRQVAVGLIADQYTRGGGQSIPFDFLNHKTLFFAGIEKLSARFGMPVYYMDVRKLGRARYSARFVMIYDGAEQLPEGEVTRRYAEALERTIRRDPPYWMWSHKRWKHRAESVETGVAEVGETRSE